MKVVFNNGFDLIVLIVYIDLLVLFFVFGSVVLLYVVNNCVFDVYVVLVINVEFGLFLRMLVVCVNNLW